MKKIYLLSLLIFLASMSVSFFDSKAQGCSIPSDCTEMEWISDGFVSNYATCDNGQCTQHSDKTQPIHIGKPEATGTWVW
jgi:hypothetical protein